MTSELIAFFLIPNPLASLWVIVTIVSIEVGVLGFMSMRKLVSPTKGEPLAAAAAA